MNHYQIPSIWLYSHFSSPPVDEDSNSCGRSILDLDGAGPGIPFFLFALRAFRSYKNRTPAAGQKLGQPHEMRPKKYMSGENAMNKYELLYKNEIARPVTEKQRSFLVPLEVKWAQNTMYHVVVDVIDVVDVYTGFTPLEVVDVERCPRNESRKHNCFRGG